MPEMAPPAPISDAEQTAAITTIIHTGDRLHAPSEDVRTVIQTLFAEVQS